MNKPLYHGLYMAYDDLGFEKHGSRSENCKDLHEFDKWLERTVKAHYKKTQDKNVEVKIIFSQKF